jgi:hypothetical protein
MEAASDIAPSAVAPLESGSVKPRKQKYRGSRPQKAKKPLLTRDVLDGRTQAAKYFDDLTNAIENDLGGHDQLSAIEQTLVQGYVGACVTLQHLNVQLALGQKIDLGEHAQCCSAMVRIASRLGLSRRAKPVQGLYEYLAANEKGGDDGGSE